MNRDTTTTTATTAATTTESLAGTPAVLPAEAAADSHTPPTSHGSAPSGYARSMVMADGIITPQARIQNILDADRLIVYEVVRIQDGQPVFWREHYDRFMNSLASIGASPELSADDFINGIRRTARECGITNNNLRIEQYRLPGTQEEHTLIYPIHSVYPSGSMFRSGVMTGLLRAERNNPQAKIFNKSMRALADQSICETGAAEVLLVNRRNEITEGSRSNVFFIKDGTVISPPQHASLPGITRMKVLEIIRENGIGYRELPVGADTLGEYDAAFLTGTSKDILPIARISSDAVSDISYNVSDPVLRIIMQEYEKKKAAGRA